MVLAGKRDESINAVTAEIEKTGGEAYPVRTRKGKAMCLSLPEMIGNNAYFLNLLLIAARPMKQGPKSRAAVGMGVVLFSS